MKRIDDFKEDKSLPHPGDPGNRREGREGGRGARSQGMEGRLEKPRVVGTLCLENTVS